MHLLVSFALLIILTGCAGPWSTDIAQITHDICDSVVSVEVDRDAFKQDTDVKVSVEVINKDAPTPVVLKTGTP